MQRRFSIAVSLILAILLGCGPAVNDSEAADSASDDSASDDSGNRDTGQDTASTESSAGVLRLGPPAPSVGSYGIIAPAGSGRVYVSNLHVPFITVADAATGAWIDAIDIREGCAEESFFPRLYLAGSVMWVTHLNTSRLCRYNLDTGAWLAPVDVDGLGGGMVVTDEGVWVATPTALFRHDGTGFVEEIAVDVWASALASEGDTLAVLSAPEGRVLVIDRSENVLWEATLPDPTLQDIELLSGRVYLTERQSGDVIALEAGVEVARVHTGSDTFAIDRLGDRLYVTNRQGAELPPAGAYTGAPGVVTALSADLDVQWSVGLSKTIHFLASDGELLWAANEDALRLSAINLADGTEVIRGEPIGLTLDHIAVESGRFFLGSHLTDELWRADFGEGELGDAAATAPSALASTVCGWPFLAVPLDGQLVVPCQETGEVWAVAPESLAIVGQTTVAETFFPACPDGLCTGHDVLIGAAADGESVVYGDAYEWALRWTDDRPAVDLGDFPDLGPLGHFDVVASGGGVTAWLPRSGTLYRVEGGEVVGTRAVSGDVAAFALVPAFEAPESGGHVWIGAMAVDDDLEQVATLPPGHVVQTAGEGWIVSIEAEELVVWEDSIEVGRLPIADLRVPPYRALGGELGPLRLRVHSGELLVANTMRGTLERRSLPDLGVVGEDAPVAVGRWAEHDGVR